MPVGLLTGVLVHELVHYRFFDLPLDRAWLTENPALPEGIAHYRPSCITGRRRRM
jgi:hypothetical protein